MREEKKAAPAAVAGPSEDVRKKIETNTWEHFGDILPTLKAISRGDWYWGANSRCKYIEIRLDTRDGGCILYDRDRVRISPEQFAFQAGGGVGKMEPWPAKNALAAAPTTQAAPQPAVQVEVLVDFPKVGTAGPFAVVDGRITLDDSTMQDLVRMLRPTWEAQAAQQDQLAEIQRLQRALAFWLPMGPSEDHPLQERIAHDAFLLAGYYGSDEPSAYELGQVALAGTAAPVAQGGAEDGARYRRLRECNSGSLVVAQITGTGEEDWHVLTERDADEAIDAEINAARSQAKEGASHG